jgi:TM2 domain-containing membrane protein YozV
MAEVFMLLPTLEGEELRYVQSLVRDMSEEQGRQFSTVYSARRKDPQLILITALIGFVGISGVHRFLLEHIGMGILYLLTGGLCLIGTIIDLINYKKLTFEYNSKVAYEVAYMIKGRI